MTMTRDFPGIAPVNHADAFAFNAELRAVASLGNCAALFRRTIAPFGFDTFACGEFDLRDRERAVFYLIDWPDNWQRFYIGSGLIRRDPLLDRLRDTQESFTWSQMRADRTLSKLGTEALDRIAAEGWTEGVAVPIPSVGYRTGLVSLVGHRQVGLAELHFLTLISVCLHHRARALAVRDGFPVPPAGLTEREIAATGHVARGATDAEIAAAMGIAKSTAHEFVEKAKVKLRARNRAELIALAVSLGIITV